MRNNTHWLNVSVAALTLATTFMTPLAPTTAVAAAPSEFAPTSCASLGSISLPNTTVNSAIDTPAGSIPPPFPGFPATPVVATCRVHATVTTPGANDHIGIDVWLPVSGWNGRFQGVGGGGYKADDPNEMAVAVNAGYSAAGTDAGHTSASPIPAFDGSFALDGEGDLNWPLIEDFAYRGVHDAAVVGKAVTAAYYGSSARYSYFNGCSTGGRQGMAEAQRYPSDFDGILAGAPAINWDRYVPASLWPELVMQRSSDFVPSCKFAAFQAAAIKACDTLGDGVVDGVIGDPPSCKFDPNSLVGTSTACGTITAQDAAVVKRIVAGAHATSGEFLWFGVQWGAPFAGDFPGTGLANTTTVNGGLVGAPFPLILEHMGTWVQQNPPVPAGTWDWTTTTYDQFDQLFQRSVEMYGRVMGTATPDLSGFKKAGGKLIMWHGQADQLIFPQGSIRYYKRVQQAMGGSDRTNDFARLFLAPGVTHCAGGPGAQPADPLGQLVAWVEKGNAPNSLNGAVIDASTGTVSATRPICMYPNVAAYKGRGASTEASNFECRRSSASTED
jgi:Tannase and feruloyl esterase